MKIVAVVFMLVLVAACAGVRGSADIETGLTFIHLNDTYRVGAVEDGSKGGFGRVVTVVRQLQAEGREVRILHAGDFLYPSLESQLWDGEQMIEGLNFLDAIAPLYLVPGNHEFDPRSPEPLVDAIRKSRFDWLADNFTLATGVPAADEALRAGFTFQHAGKTIGIFALTLHADDGGNERGYLTIEKDFLKVARRSIAALEVAGADVIIGLTHLHMSQDKVIAELRAQHPKLLFIVGGHEHEPQYSPLRADSAAVMKGASNARAIWRIDVNFDASGEATLEANTLALDTSVDVDADYLVLENKWRDKLLAVYPFLGAQLGEAALTMDSREVAIRNQETSWGNFVVDQMRVAFGREPADLAFLNSGTLRLDDFVQDDIRFEDIGRTFGFSSYLRYMTLSGEEFRAVLEAGYRGDGPSHGYFPQVSGFRVCVDRRLPDGERIVSLQVPLAEGWAEIDADHDYDVVVSDYLHGGGDGYTFPAHREASKRGSELKYLVLDAILLAQANGKPVGQAVDPDNPRFVALGPARGACW